MTEFVKERAVYVNDEEGHYFWSDLSPFTRGYIEAMFADEAEAALASFSDLSPGTLARIIADCATADHLRPGVSNDGDQRAGRGFWELRQSGALAKRFPPLTVQLSDGGKVRFAA